ncbi:hypothetical protein [Acetobacter sp. DsW_063]|uniref:hypothetical protein n=1 Tax=Acetobacter sp. DsW_063 TaxID=1514894 RepID=UPI0013026575|nr:hypothetical protein [Acetobacter sp. DsW_063]
MIAVQERVGLGLGLGLGLGRKICDMTKADTLRVRGNLSPLGQVITRRAGSTEYD